MTSPKPQATIPTLYNLSSSLSFKCLWALEEISLANPAFTYHLKNYPRAKGVAPQIFKEVHKLGKAPVLTVEHADGSPPPTIQITPGVVSESKLVLQFLSEEYGNGLFEPASDEEKKRDRFFEEFATMTLTLKADFTLLFDIVPTQLPFPLSYFVKLMVSPIVSHFRKDLATIFQMMEDNLSDEMPYFGGAKLGLSDLNMSFGFDICEQRGWFDAEKYPRVAEWKRRCEGREAWKKAGEKGCGYDLKTWT
jgi:glutathione S-transferase